MTEITVSEESDSLGSKIILCSALILAIFLVFSWLDSVPGLHGDEAFVGLRAHDILKGERPILGMNGYTGSLHQYMTAMALGIFGFKVWALRLFGAITSVISVFLYYLCVKRIANPRIAALSALILATMPFFVGFSRIANEVFMLNPILSLGAIYLLLSADKYSPPTRRLFYFYSGILIGLGIWTHLIFLSVVLSLLATALFRQRWRLFTSSPLYLAVLGAAISLSPRIYYQLESGDSLGQSFRLSRFTVDFLMGVGIRLREWPSVFLHTLHGDELFQRFTGTILFNPPAISAVLWLVSWVYLLFVATRNGARSLEAMLVVFTTSLFFATLLISPGNMERYLLLPLYTTPVFIAYLFWKSVKGKPIYVIAALFACFQLTLIGINYFHSFLHTQGENSTFGLGEQTETSNHYINTKGLFLELNEMGASQVCSEFFIAAPLMFYKLSNKTSFDISWDEADCLKNRASEKSSIYAVVYKMGKRDLSLDQLPSFAPIKSDMHFLILTRGLRNG